MTNHASTAPSLRLVNTGASSKRNASPPGNAPTAQPKQSSSPAYDPLRALADARSPKTAPTSDLLATDARWVFAVRVAKAIEPGPEPTLLPDRRRRLMSIAKALGLRPFDANLIIAIVQDAARAGEPLSGSVEERLGLVRATPDSAVSKSSLILVAIATAALTAGLVAWSAIWIINA